MSAHVAASPQTAWQRQLQASLAGVRVRCVDTIDSTNSALMRQAQRGDTTPTLLLAAEQTAGRGRAGHQWRTSAGDQALTFSLGLPLAPADWSGLSLVVGVTVAAALHPAIQLKWPNDLWWDRRKLGGILIETCAIPAQPHERFVVMGVGINLQRPPQYEGDVAPAWIAEWEPEVTAEHVLSRMAQPLLEAAHALAAHGFAPWVAAYAQRDALRDCDVLLQDGRAARALGVADDGCLRLLVDGEERLVRSGEVRVRPVHSSAPALAG